MAKCTQSQCIVTINGMSKQFTVDEPKPHAMVCTDLAVKRIIRDSCFCPYAEVTYIGMLVWSVSIDGVVVGNAKVSISSGGF